MQIRNVIKHWQKWFKELGFSFLFTLFLLVVTAVILLGIAIPRTWSKISLINQRFLSAANRDAWSIATEVWTGVQASWQDSPVTKRYLLLGTDEVEGSNRSAVLTDTIMLVSWNAQSNQVKLLSFPRDLYHGELATKINALYWYGGQRYPSQPELLTEQTIEKMIGQPIASTVVLSLVQVQELIDLLGGVEVDVQHSFTDENFPRSGVDVQVVTDPAILYETIHFEAGPQVMDGEKALKFMRSRKAIEADEQNDEARQARQQQVITAIVQRLQSPEVILDPVRLGSLYRWYADNFMADVSLFEVGQVIGSVGKKRQFPDMQRVELPSTMQAVATQAGTLLVHPPTEKYGQWVYEPADPTWSEFQQFVLENGL